MTRLENKNESEGIMSKKDFHNEMSKLMDQVKEKMHKFGKDASVLAKKGEKEIVKASQIGKLELDIMGLNIHKEKLYYDMGKKIAELKGEGLTDAVKPFIKELEKIETDAHAKRIEIQAISKRKSK